MVDRGAEAGPARAASRASSTAVSLASGEAGSWSCSLCPLVLGWRLTACGAGSVTAAAGRRGAADATGSAVRCAAVPLV